MHEEILKKNPSADLRVYAVWFNMVAGDSRSGWDGAGMNDPRVVHLWDEQKAVGDFFAAKVTRTPGTAWDAYFLYGPDATWGSEPAPLVGNGRTIIARRAQLQEGIVPLLASTKPG